MVLCTGVMNRAKDIVQLVKTWQGLSTNLKLKVIGYFPDKNTYREAQEYADHDPKKRVEISDCYTDTDSYYRMLAEARFVILPYRESRYNNRTSGILLESIFLDTPVLAPRFLLEYTNLPGIGYSKLEDLEEILSTIDEQSIRETQEKMKKVRIDYSPETVRQRILQALSCCSFSGALPKMVKHYK